MKRKNITLIPLLILCLLLCSCNAVSPHTVAVSLPDGRSVLIPYLMAENKTYYRTGYVDCEEFSRMFQGILPLILKCRRRTGRQHII